MSEASVDGIAFTAGQAAALAGASYGAVNLWAKDGLVVPSIQAGSGSGNYRWYAFDDVVRVAVAYRMRRAGASLAKIRLVLDHVAQLGPLSDMDEGAFLALDEEGNVFSGSFSDEEEAAVNLRVQGMPAGLLTMVPLGVYVESIREALEGMPKPKRRREPAAVAV